MSAAGASVRAWIDSRCEAVNAALEQHLASSRAPAVILDAMRYPVAGGGKRLRPLLALAAAEAIAERHGTLPETAVALAMPCACALEYIHTYSLVHDDLPAMDNDTLRRGRPTTHVVFGDGMAILAGDGLLTDAFRILARAPVTIDGVSAEALAARKLETIAVIAEAAGAAGMVGGQALDLQAAGPGASPLDAGQLRDMHMRKTGALIRAAALAGATMAGGDAGELDAIGRFGSHVGLAFQIVDDILDIEGASADLGKTAGKDAAAGKPTYPAIFGLEESKRLAMRCLDEARDALTPAGLGGQLPGLGRWVIDRRH